MTDYVRIDGQPYCTPKGALAHAKRADWKAYGGAPLSLEAAMRKLARTYRAAVLIEDDGSVTTYVYSGGKVRLRIAEAGSDEAAWLIGRFEAASAADAR